MKKAISKLTLIVVSSLVALLLGELILRIYNPVQTRVVGDKIKLQNNFYRKIELEPGSEERGLVTPFDYSTNAWGLRGSEIPQDPESYYNIVAIGGSTTECSLLDDSMTWPAVLEKLFQADNEKILVQNAGLDGTSSYGHQILLEEHILPIKPQMAIYLVGMNDLFQGLYPNGDSFLSTLRKYRLRSFAQKSQVFNLALSVYRVMQVENLTVKGGGESPEPLSPSEYLETRDLHTANQGAYRARLEKLIQTSQDNNIQPVLVTQPFQDACLRHYCAGLDIYNQTTTRTGSDNNVPVIDLASLIKNPSYYYDDIHYNVEGANKVAEIMAKELISMQPSVFTRQN